MGKYWSQHLGRYQKTYTPQINKSAYTIELKGKYFEMKREMNGLGKYSKNHEKQAQYEMKKVYNGKLFDIIAESLYNSIGLCMTETYDPHEYPYSNWVPPTVPVYLDLHIKAPSPYIIHHYIKLSNPINIEIFQNEYAGEENKKRIINEWTTILKNSKLVKPFLSKDTTFISWDPGKGNETSNISHPLVNYIGPRVLSNDIKVIEKYDPAEDTDLTKYKDAYTGILTIQPSDEYTYKILVELYNQKIKELFKQGGIPDMSILTDDAYIDNMTEEQALTFSTLTTKGKRLNTIGNKIDWTCGSYSKKIIPRPKLGDKELVVDEDKCITYDEFLQENYPKFYNKIFEVIGKAEYKYNKKRHDRAQQYYDHEYSIRDDRFTAKQTHIDIIESLKYFEKIYNNEFDVHDPDELNSYFYDIYGSISEYLSKKGSEKINEYYNDLLKKYIKSYPRKKCHQLIIDRDDAPYKLDTINNTLQLNIFKYDSPIYKFISGLNSIIGFTFPLGTNGKFKAFFTLKNQSENMEIGTIHINNGKTPYFGLTVMAPFNKIDIEYQLVPDKNMVNYNITNDNLSSVSKGFRDYGIEDTPELREFKQNIFKSLLSCLSGKFEYKIKDDLWESTLPPYEIYMEYDEEKANSIMEKIKNTEIYKNILKAEKAYSDRNQMGIGHRKWINF